MTLDASDKRLALTSAASRTQMTRRNISLEQGDESENLFPSPSLFCLCYTIRINIYACPVRSNVLTWAHFQTRFEISFSIFFWDFANICSGRAKIENI